MNETEAIIEKLKKTAENPKAAVESIAADGKRVCGIMPAYVPEELAYAAGYIPVGIWGGNANVKNAQSVLPPFACSIMLSVMESFLEGVYDVCDFIMVSSLCDTLKCMGQKMKKNANIIQISHPHNKNAKGAKEFLVKEYTEAKNSIEKISGAIITEESLKNAVDVYNKNFDALRKFASLSSLHTDVVTPSVRHFAFKAGFFMDRKEHTTLIEELCRLLEGRKIVKGSKRLMLTGIMADDMRVIKIMEKHGFSAAADELLNESRFIAQNTPQDNSCLEALAEKWLRTKNCSLAYDMKKSRIENIVKKAKEAECDAVVICFMPFCDVEGFDEPLLAERLKKEHIPFIKLDFGGQDINLGRADTKLGALAEMLEF